MKDQVGPMIRCDIHLPASKKGSYSPELFEVKKAFSTKNLSVLHVIYIYIYLFLLCII